MEIILLHKNFENHHDEVQYINSNIMYISLIFDTEKCQQVLRIRQKKNVTDTVIWHEEQAIDCQI